MRFRERRTPIDKLNAVLFRPEVKLPPGKPSSVINPADFYLDAPVRHYLEGAPALQTLQRIYDVREYGAVPNDRDRLATRAINETIDLCARNGGGVVLLTGGDYSCGTLVLKSNVTLWIDRDARLTAASNPACYSRHALLFAKGARNVTVTGGGSICGFGTTYALAPQRSPEPVPLQLIDVVEMQRLYRAQMRGVSGQSFGGLIWMQDCEQVSIHHLEWEDAPEWGCLLQRCKVAEVHHIALQNNRHLAGTDGIVLAGSSRVSLHHCLLSTGGDGIVLKNPVWMDCNAAMGHITVANCAFITPGNGVLLTDCTADLYDVAVQNCKFYLKDIFPGMMSGVSVIAADGGMICDINLSGLRMEQVTCPLFFRAGNRNKAASLLIDQMGDWERPRDVMLPVDKSRFDWKSGLRRVCAQDVTAVGMELPVVVAGLQEWKKGVKYVEQVELKALDLQYRACREVYDRRLFIPEQARVEQNSWMFRNLPAYGLWCRHVKGLHTERFQCQPARSTWRPCFVQEDVK